MDATTDASDRLIIALDCDGHQAMALARTLVDEVRWLKVGMTLFYEQGPEIVERLRALGFEIFLDLKLHDIPHQVEGAARQVAALGARMLTVHAAGGRAMIEAAVRGAEAGARDAGVSAPAVIAVTVLTSMSDAELPDIGVGTGAVEQVERLANLAKGAGVAGVVCSPKEAAIVRTVVGESALVVTPGVRPLWADAGDQSRIATPTSALNAGASHLVIGRPVTDAASPAYAAAQILQEMEGVFEGA
ncbi:MAG: orotidine-5'-phosphate decarboxylase [Coriobacteriia bacterium]|nr:orotidine-5'-phosphate decarboxylase [Coriobacteriia bacterium]